LSFYTAEIAELFISFNDFFSVLSISKLSKIKIIAGVRANEDAGNMLVPCLHKKNLSECGAGILPAPGKKCGWRQGF
jgi:hypothetical protein